MGKFLKENWFVALVAVFFVTISIYFAYDQNKGKLPGKKEAGKDVVFSIDGQNITADALYEKLADDYLESDLYMAFYKGLLDEAIETTDDLKTRTDSTVQNYIAMYQQYYGYGEDYLNYLAKQYYGYDTFRDYVFYSLKSEKLFSDYVLAHLDELVNQAFLDKYKPRTVSYVVIAMADPKNPTAEETAKFEEAKQAWASDKYSAANFGEFAAAYSQDGNASNQGKLGYVDTNTSNLDKAFTDVALNLKEGEVSDWIHSDEFGYYLIKCDSTKVEDLKTESGFTATILSADENLSNKILKEKAAELKITFGSKEIEELIMKQLESDGETE
jgi:foldase protein PrsA